MLTAAPSAPAAQPKDASPSDLPPPKRAFDGLRMTSVEHDARASQPDLSADPSLEEIDAAAAIIAAEEDREYIFRNVLSHSLTTDQELRARAEGPWYSLENLPTFIANRDDHRRQVATWRAKARDVIVLARKPLADEIGRLRAEVERQGGVIADMAANGVDDVAGDALDDRDDAIEALQARATAAEAERDRLLSDRVALMVERDAALSRERAMREALEPFRAWAVYQIERAMPQAVAADGGTLVLGEERYGDEPACPVVYVGDLRKLAALTTSAPAQPSLPERFEAAVSKAEAAPAQQGAGEAPYDPTAEMLAAGVEALSDPDVTTPAGRAGLVWRSMARAAGLTEGAEHG